MKIGYVENENRVLTDSSQRGSVYCFVLPSGDFPRVEFCQSVTEYLGGDSRNYWQNLLL